MSQNKKVKSDPSAEAVGPDAQVEQLDLVQEEIEKVNEEAAEKILEVEKQYYEKKIPLFKKRNEVCAKIPEFWLSTFLSFDFSGSRITNEDEEVFKYLKDFWVEEYEDLKGFKLTFTFAPNPFFDNDVLFVEITFSEGESQPKIPQQSTGKKERIS
eukprot:TRINITY_DN4795_c0_g1_i1.p1 TRINITY_DN4795_c0_g1~~TRINITY_DN4795_c0_g1_i1.p1  ORF type:complete len:156 (+),score=60.73 TRINITY_DN4795_c0_g1_i1:174-641(+)